MTSSSLIYDSKIEQPFYTQLSSESTGFNDLSCYVVIVGRQPASSRRPFHRRGCVQNEMHMCTMIIHAHQPYQLASTLTIFTSSDIRIYQYFNCLKVSSHGQKNLQYWLRERLEAGTWCFPRVQPGHSISIKRLYMNNLHTHT